MSTFSKFIAAVTGEAQPTPLGAHFDSVAPIYSIPTVKFDHKRVTEAIKVDLKNNIKEVAEFDETNFDPVYDAALQSISRGGDLAVLFNAIMELNLPAITKQRAREISRSLNNRARVLIERDRQMSLGIKYAIWIYSGAPCQVNPKKPSAKDISQNAAHREADGKQYEVAKGMLLNGRLTRPGEDEGCKCSSRSVIPRLAR